MKNRIAVLGSFALVLLLQQPSMWAFQSSPSNSAPTLKQFFEQIIRIDNFSLPAENTNLNDVEKQIPASTSDDITKALPPIFTALSNSNEEVRWCAISALTMISRRSDSTDLLRNYIGKITELWNASDGKLQGTPAAILNNVKLNSYPEVLPLMVKFIGQRGRAPEAQSATLFVLARNYPFKPETIQTVNGFLSRSLDPATRINTLHGVSLSGMNDSETQHSIIKALDEPESSVKLAAIHAIERMGPNAVDEAMPILLELSQNRDVAPEIRSAASDAIKLRQK